MGPPETSDVDEADSAPFKIVQEQARLEPVSEPVGDAPPRPPVGSEFIEFEVTLDKSGGEKLGLDISPYDGKTLLVGKVKPGPVERWNEQHQEQWEKCVFRGDRMIVINGVRGDSDELLGAAKADVLNVTLCRRIEFVVAIEYSGSGNFGLDFQDTSDGRVIIRQVGEGVVEDTNRLNPSDMEIRSGYQVLQLDGVDVSDAEAVQRAMALRTSSQAAGTLTFRFRRLPGPKAAEA